MTLRHLLRFPSTSAGFEEASGSLQRLLDTRALSADCRSNVELAFEEIVSNIIRHGSASGDVDVAVAFEDDEVVLTFEDDGVPFDPRAQPPRPAPASIAEAQVGGLGLVLVRSVSTRIEYSRTLQQHNQLTLAIPVRART